ncbi:MAG: hypothetical protein IK099_12735 [Clostridia bacterium]|nr:hypothetical protein [Clostridia bacterium]
MNTITVSEAFSNAPPRSPAVLCLKGPDGATDMILTDWFTWLNIKRNPMISFSMPKNASLGLNLKEGDAFALAFPLTDEALKYRQGVRTAAEGQERKLPDGVEPIAVEGLEVLVPKGSEVVLRCTLAGAYNYPFKKVRIFNCNLEEAAGNTERTLD